MDWSLRPPLPDHDASFDPTPLPDIEKACQILRVSIEARFTAACLWHRCRQSWPVCLWLACKREEEPRRMRDILNVMHIVRDGGELPLLNAAYWKSKEELVEQEQVVLRSLAFDVCVSHPYRGVLVVEQNPTIVQRAFDVVHRSVYCREALTKPVMVLACAAVVLAREDLGESTVTGEWWREYEVKDEDLRVVVEALRRTRNELEVGKPDTRKHP